MYALYALLFADHGMSVGQISSLFVIWSVTTFVFEVPSGAWADTVSRRGLLVLSAALYACCFAAWTYAPSYLGFALGFVLWGISSALMSGTFEALLYDELAAVGAADAYAGLTGIAHSIAMGCVLVATVSAAPLYAVGGYHLVGAVSIAVALLQGLLALALPSAPRAAPAAETAGSGGGTFVERYLGMLRTGLTEVHRRPVVRHGVLLCSLLLGTLAYDEFFPLLAREQGATDSAVPLLIGITVLGQVIGTALAGLTARMSARVIAGIVAAATVGLVVGSLLGQVAGFILLGVGYGLANNAIIVSEARLQDAIEGPARATVTSVYGLLSEVVAVAAFALFALGAAWWTVATTLAALTLPVLLVALLVPRWLPSRVGRTRDGGGGGGGGGGGECADDRGLGAVGVLGVVDRVGRPRGLRRCRPRASADVGRRGDAVGVGGVGGIGLGIDRRPG